MIMVQLNIKELNEKVIPTQQQYLDKCGGLLNVNLTLVSRGCLLGLTDMLVGLLFVWLNMNSS